MSTPELFLLAGLALAGLMALIGTRLGKYLGMLAALLPASAFVWGITAISRLPEPSKHSWLPSTNLFFEINVTHLGLLFWLLISGIGTLIFIYAGAYMKPDNQPRMLATLSVFMVAMLGIASAGSTITLFLFWELTSITSFLLIGFNRESVESRQSAIQALAVTGLGGLVLLAGLILLGLENGNFSFSNISTASPAAMSLIIIGCMTKSAQFPFHFWLPNAMAAPTPVSAYLHSATMVKAGVFLLAKLSPVFGPQPILMWIGALTLTWASVLALGETDLKRILAWSTVAALGLMVSLIGVGTPAAAEAVAFIILAHALYKGALFMVAGSIDLATGTRDATRLGGIAKLAPPLFVPALLASLSFAGLIPFAGFIKKELALAAAPNPVISGAIIISAISGVIASLVILHRVFLRPAKESIALVTKPTPGLYLPPLILAVLGLGVGILCHQVGSLFIKNVASDIAGEPVSNHIELWHGPTPAFILSTLAILIGTILYPSWPKIQGALSQALSAVPATIEHGFRRLNTITTSLGRNVVHFYEKRSVRVHLLLNFTAFLVIVISIFIRSPISLQLPDGPNIHFHEFFILLFAAVASVAVISIPTRMGSVAVLGIVGVAMTVTYVTFSAPDLALTQALIDVLTVILFVLVFSRLPRFHNRLSTLAKTANVVIAVAFGTTMAYLLLAVLSQPQIPPISQYFNENAMALGYGRNIVNVIIVDFRALDTLGEVTVLCLAALGVHGLIRLRLGYKKEDIAQ